MSGRFEAMAGSAIMVDGEPVKFRPEPTAARLAREGATIPSLETLLPRDVFVLDEDGIVTDKRYGYVAAASASIDPARARANKPNSS